MQVPLVATAVTAPVDELTVQIFVSALVYVTASEDEAVALTVVVPPAGSGLALEPQVILCAVFAVTTNETHEPTSVVV